MSQDMNCRVALNIAVLTVSDTRNSHNDESGAFLKESLLKDSHDLTDYTIVKDDRYQLRSIVSHWLVRSDIDVILTTGGTGFSSRDVTPEALAPLFDKRINGFGEFFRGLSSNEIGSSTIQSRAIAGLANNKLIFCLPGSTSACATAWNQILSDQLNSEFKPCNFVNSIYGRHVAASLG